MNIRSGAGSLCLLTLPLAATATEPAASPFPDRPYLLQFKRSLPATAPTPSAPGRGMTPSLSMGPGTRSKAAYTADVMRVVIRVDTGRRAGRASTRPVPPTSTAVAGYAGSVASKAPGRARPGAKGLAPSHAGLSRMPKPARTCRKGATPCPKT